MKNITLITGGARSGKSALAEKIASQSELAITYLATMPYVPGDEEQLKRIERHRVRRPAGWRTIETGKALASDVLKLAEGPGLVIVDCLSLFVANLLLGEDPGAAEPAHNPHSGEEAILNETQEVLHSIAKREDLHFVIVTNEVGWGVVPDTALGRAFRDVLGLANQQLARNADTVWLCCAGIPVKLKPQTASI